MKNVIIYSTPSCHFCNLAKEYFKSKGVEYTDHNVIGDIEKQKEMIQLSGQMGVPVIVIGESVVVGFNQPQIESILG
jgi:glutaredoxin 3